MIQRGCATGSVGRGISLLTLAFCTGLTVPPAFAQQATSADDIRRKLEEQKAKLDSERKRAQDLKADVNQIQSERERLAQRLQETARLVQASEAQLTEIEARREELDEQEKLVRGSLDARYATISRLMSGMQRIGRNPPPMIITKRDDALSMVRSAMLLASAYPELRTQAMALKSQLDQLVDIMDKNKAEGERLKAETQRHEDARRRLASLMEERRQTLAQRQAALTDANRTAQEMARSVQDLTGLIERLERQAARQVQPVPVPQPPVVALPKAEPTPPRADNGIVSTVTPPPGAPQPELPAAQPPAPPPTVRQVETIAVPVPGSQAPAPPTQPVPPPAVELAPSPNQVALAIPRRLEPGTSFANMRGKLQLPAQGRRVLSYGERGPTIRSEGIAIETRASAQITSPCEGTIMYAGEFRSYGQVLIINAGGGYLVLLAGLHQIDVQVGQAILAGEPVGTMSPQRGAPSADRGRTGRSGSAGTASGEDGQRAAPVLYVEFRKDGKSIDSAPWWAEGTRKVQG
ncbi:MAG: hypothetical protein RL291_2003 [Pseudomonadota bacterium]